MNLDYWPYVMDKDLPPYPMSVRQAKRAMRAYRAGESVDAARFHRANEVLAEHYGLDSLRWPALGMRKPHEDRGA